MIIKSRENKMKAKENILYYTEEYLNDKLINDSNISIDVKEISLSQEDGDKLRDILGDNISQASHRCISVYRDGFIHNNHTYNICLSCGDFYRDDAHYYLTSEGIEQFKSLKELLISRKKYLKQEELTDLIIEMKEAIEWYMDNTTVMNDSRSYYETFHDIGMNLIVRAKDILWKE